MADTVDSKNPMDKKGDNEVKHSDTKDNGESLLIELISVIIIKFAIKCS